MSYYGTEGDKKDLRNTLIPVREKVAKKKVQNNYKKKSHCTSEKIESYLTERVLPGG